MAIAPTKAPKMSLAHRLMAKTKNEFASILGEEEKFPIRDWIDTGSVALNCLISGDPYKGIPSGKIVQFAGINSTGKTYIAIDIAKAAQAMGYTVLLYDSEMASNEKQSMINRGLDVMQLIHSPIDTAERLKTDMLNMIDTVDKDDKLLIIVDSIGNLSTNKELADSTEGKDTKDMTRAGQLKALFRTCTLKAGVKNVPIVVINHVYASIGSFIGGNEIGGGSGSLYLSSIIMELTKAQDKDANGIVAGAIVTVTSKKNRFARERQKVKFSIDFNTGLKRYSGLFDIAMDLGIFKKKSNVYTEWNGQSYKKSQMTPEFWESVLAGGFADALRKKFKYQSSTEGILDDNGDTDEDALLDYEIGNEPLKE